MDRHIQRLIDAISLVEPKYEVYTTISPNREALVKRGERVYAYELYHQYRCLMERDKVTDCHLNGEIYKDAKVFNAIDGHSCYPDLILHKAFDKIDEESQFFLCEIKMRDNPTLLDDLEKLTKLSESELNFRYYIFLCIGLLMDDLKKNLKNNTSYYNENIICICVNEGKIEFDELKHILNNN